MNYVVSTMKSTMYLGLSLLCWCCILGLSACSDETCKPPFHKFAKSCYYIRRDQVTGDEAFARCINMGGYLANFETLEEAMLMKQKLTRMNSGLSFYVGGRNINRRRPGGDWRWIKNGTMTEMAYFAFGAGEPNGGDRSPEDCMSFLVQDFYKFHSYSCHVANCGYICEK